MDDKLTSPCPVCNKEISKKAQSCPHCGEPFVINTRPQKIKQESSPVVKYGGGCLLVFIGLFIIGGLLDSRNPAVQERRAAEERRQLAHIGCEGVIEKSLKSPSTAKFSSYAESSVTEEDNVYTVHAYVDAQNSFGATIRKSFTCRSTYNPANGKWRLDYARINE